MLGRRCKRGRIAAITVNSPSTSSSPIHKTVNNEHTDAQLQFQTVSTLNRVDVEASGPYNHGSLHSTDGFDVVTLDGPDADYRHLAFVDVFKTSIRFECNR